MLCGFFDDMVFVGGFDVDIVVVVVDFLNVDFGLYVLDEEEDFFLFLCWWLFVDEYLVDVFDKLIVEYVCDCDVVYLVVESF